MSRTAHTLRSLLLSTKLAATLLVLVFTSYTPPAGAQIPGLRVKPPTPSALSPVDPIPGTNRNAPITFRWQPGELAGNTIGLPVSSFQICVYETTRCDASGPGERVHYRRIDADTTQFTPWNGLPWTTFQGTRFQWAVAACALPNATSKTVVCSWSDPVTLEWLLPAPALRGVTTLAPNGTTARFEFEWHVVERAEYYLLCVTTGPASRCGPLPSLPGAFDPIVKRRRPTVYELDFDIPMFRDRDVIWTVAACSDRLSEGQRCTYQSPPLTLAYPNLLQAPEITPIREIRDDRPVRLSWSVHEPENVRSIRLCVLLGDPRASSQPRSCERGNVMLDPIRAGNTTACTLERPFPGYPGTRISYSGFSVGACNARDHCWWSQEAIMFFDGYGHYFPFAICR